MHHLYVVILLLFPGSVAGQTRWQWTDQSPATAPSDNVRGWCIATDRAGNVYVAGSFSGTTVFGETNAPVTSFGGSDGFLAKYDRSGVLRWASKFGGPGFDAAYAVALDSTGNVYLGGGYAGPAVFDSLTLTNPAAGFIAKMEPATGKAQWVRESALEWSGIAVDARGNPHLVGRPAALDIHSDQPVEPIALARYNANGVCHWYTNSLIPGRSIPGARHSIALDVSGNIHVTRRFPGPGGSAGGAAPSVAVTSFTPLGVRMHVAGAEGSSVAEPRIVSATSLGNGVVRLKFVGATGEFIVTEASSSLPDWVPISTNNLGGGAIQFSDPGSGGASGRFYRLKVPR